MKILNPKITNGLLAMIVATLVLFFSSCVGGEKQSQDKLTGELELNGQTHTFSIGAITHEAGKTTIELIGDGQAVQFKGHFSSDGSVSFVSPVLMSIEVKGKTIPCENDDIYLLGSDFKFVFHTDKEPDKINVYRNDEEKLTITFNGKTKKIVG
ncbi:MAG: hypothetical protein LBS01_08555 [Prevotellaceae bacterium]|jgi:hypothetical protein|nr:hypothetical protein [Prevotellaceae bacterium]